MTKIIGAIDSQGKCNHYRRPLDIRAIKFRCCNEFYSCIDCHLENAEHQPQRWSPEQFHEQAILCGVCKKEISIAAYIHSNSNCPSCQANFNPKCKNHFHLYFY